MRLAPILALPLLLVTPLEAGALAASADAPFPGAAVGDDEIAATTGKFVLPNGVELALAVTSDTVMNGQLILRTVFTVDNDAQLTVLGRESAAAGQTGTGSSGQSGGAGGVAPTGISVSFDRQSGIQTITPTYAATGSTTVSIGGVTQQPDPTGLSKLPVTPGGPAVATADGLVTVQQLANGSLVTLSGDRLSVANLVGQSVATVIANTGNDRNFDTVTNVAIDLKNAAPYVAGSAALRVDDLALDATRGMLR
ncbi:MAG: hypothetical protein ACTHMG_10690 [Sphingomonas sp.]